VSERHEEYSRPVSARLLLMSSCSRRAPGARAAHPHCSSLAKLIIILLIILRNSILQEDERRGTGSAPPAHDADDDDEDDGEYGDEDLLASTAGAEENASSGKPIGSSPGSRQAFM
jgi:hypothetical protein